MDEGTFPLLGVIVEVREQVFRIARMSAGKCGVVRVADNVRVGTFSHGPGILQITAEKVDVPLMAEIAAAAMRKGM
ncbi:MAG TPA: hypothetical protein VF881_12880 [Polyangiaceae bacterium]